MREGVVLLLGIAVRAFVRHVQQVLASLRGCRVRRGFRGGENFILAQSVFLRNRSRSRGGFRALLIKLERRDFPTEL